MKRQKSNKYQSTYTSRYDYNKMSWSQLQHDFRILVKEANSIIREVDKKGLRNYGAVYARKYNTMLFGNTIENIGTKKGLFSSKFSKRENMIARMRAMDEFINNPNVQAKKIQRDLDDLAKRIGLKDTALLLKIFDVYKAYGFESYKDDSDRLLIAFSEVANKGGDPERLAKFLERIETLEHNATQEDIANAAELFRDHYNAYGDWDNAEQYAEENMYNSGSNKTKEQRKLAARANIRRRHAARERLKK